MRHRCSVSLLNKSSLSLSLSLSLCVIIGDDDGAHTLLEVRRRVVVGGNDYDERRLIFDDVCLCRTKKQK